MAILPPLAVPDTTPLFPALHAELIRLLRSLGSPDWERSTVAGQWRVRDVAMHLLDGELRTLGAHRDGHQLRTGKPVESYADVLSLIQELNASGVAYGHRLSPRMLVDLLEVSGRWMSAFVMTLDPDAPALFAVAWAGESVSNNRLDTAREYTERWHHQMQIRTAVGAGSPETAPEVLLADSYLTPLLDTAVRVLPHVYRSTDAPDGAAIAIALGDRPWSRTLRRENGRWMLYAGVDEGSVARVTTSPDKLWRHFFNALPPDLTRSAFQVEGNTSLLEPFWTARSVMV